MAWVHQIKFFYKKSKLYVALFDDSHISEFWIDNIEASELNIEKIPKGFVAERKYHVQDLNIAPFEYSQNNFLFKMGDFVNQLVKGRSSPSVVVENYMSSDTYNVGQAGAVGKAARSDHNTFHQSEQKQTLAEAAVEIQRLLNVLAVDNPDANEFDKINFVNDETTPSFKRRVVGALKSGSETAVTEFFDNPYINVFKAIVEGWIEVN